MVSMEKLGGKLERSYLPELPEAYRRFYFEENGRLVSDEYFKNSPVRYDSHFPADKVFIPRLMVADSPEQIQLANVPRLALVYYDDRGKDEIIRFGQDEAMSVDYFTGLENYYVFFTSRNRPLYVFDNHNNALFAWQEAREAGLLEGNVALVRLDAHTDMETPLDFRQDINRRAIKEALSANTIDIKNFTEPALRQGLIDMMYLCTGSPLAKVGEKIKDSKIRSRQPEFRTIFAYQEKFNDITDAALERPDDYLVGLMKKLIQEGYKIILDVDFDVFEDRKEDTETVKAQKNRILEKLPEIVRYAQVVTCATSPAYADQEKALKMVQNFIAGVISAAN